MARHIDGDQHWDVRRAPHRDAFGNPGWRQPHGCNPLGANQTCPLTGQAARPVVLKPLANLPPASEGVESPYDPEVRYRSKRGMNWTGYAAHLTETCDEDSPNLIIQVMTTTASVHEANCTAAIQQALVDKGLSPDEHFLDAGYVHAEVLVSGQESHGIRIIGPPRGDASWQNRTEGAFGVERFAIDWEQKQARCPEGRISTYWKEHPKADRGPYVSVGFSASDCRACPVRAQCTRAVEQGQHLKIADSITLRSITHDA